MCNMIEKEESKNVKSIEKAFNILMCFGWNQRNLTLTEIAKKMGMAKSTTSRLLTTIVDMGFLTRDSITNKYMLGSKIYYLGQVAGDTLDLRRISIPILRELTDATQETSHIYVFKGLERICLEQVESPQVIKQSVRIGSVEPLWHGASGKAILAFLCEDVWNEALSSKGETDQESSRRLKNELQIIRERGYAVRDGSMGDDVGCVAAPFFDVRGRAMGSIAVSWPAFRFPKDSAEYIRKVADAAQNISTQLGCLRK